MMQNSSAAESRTPMVQDRQHWVSPTGLMDRLELNDGMTVAEIGAGSGYFTVALAQRVGPRGRVFAVESRPALLAGLRAALHTPESPRNVMTVEGSAPDTHLPDHCCNLVVMADLLHEMGEAERCAALHEAKRILSEDGHLAILEWRCDASSPPGPPVEQRIPFGKAVCLVEMSSWSLHKAREIDVNGYLLVMTPTDESVQS